MDRATAGRPRSSFARSAWGALWVALPVVLVGCPQVGSFDGGRSRGGDPIDPGPTAADIGTRCVYARDGANPSAGCPLGMHCLISTSDGAYVDFVLPAWEDQFTRFLPDEDEGYCTLVGTVQAPPSCPTGSLPKIFEGGIVACLRTCTAPAECGRGGYTCDVRYLDVPVPLCVRNCELDVPDCVRTGMFFLDEGQQSVAAVLSLEDTLGASTCNANTGLCANVNIHGAAGAGGACTSTADCASSDGVGAACYQGPLLGAVLGLDEAASGFCATPCNPALNATCAQGGECPCGDGQVCQASGALSLGYPGSLVRAENGAILQTGGFCFPDCGGSAGDGPCNGAPGSVCASVDEEALGADGADNSLCLPPALAQPAGP